ncbi:hypothetical protein BJ741DRAFT_86962 [Chytriomyces cf. hyalinus JEL632]|nr:hypothetical protein BJ741DRAFT_86962 [Chytriomyces cf. hyalinus JEL632]
MQRDWSLASSSSSSSSQIDPVQSESPLTPKQAQKRARESNSPPQAHQNPPTAPLDDAAVENNELNCDLGDLAAVFDGSQHKAQMIMSFIQRIINQANQQHGESIQTLLRDRESKIAEQERQIEQQRIEIQELRQIIEHRAPAASNGPPAVPASAAWQVQQRGAASSRGGKRVSRGGAVVGASRSAQTADNPDGQATYTTVAKTTVEPRPTRQFPSYAEKLKLAKQEWSATAQAASNLELLADLKKQQECCTNPPVCREPVEYKSFIIENPLGNRTRFVQNPLRRIRSILACLVLNLGFYDIYYLKVNHNTSKQLSLYTFLAPIKSHWAFFSFTFEPPFFSISFVISFLQMRFDVKSSIFHLQFEIAEKVSQC